MQFGTWPLADSDPAISSFFLRPSVVHGLSSFGVFVKESVQTENPASVFTGASFWNNAENLWHCWPPLQSDTVVNGWPTVWWATTLRKRKMNQATYCPVDFLRYRILRCGYTICKYYSIWIIHRACRPGFINAYSVGLYNVNIKRGSSIWTTPSCMTLPRCRC